MTKKGQIGPVGPYIFGKPKQLTKPKPKTRERKDPKRKTEESGKETKIKNVKTILFIVFSEIVKVADLRFLSS
jgi:hypothetical protein